MAKLFLIGDEDTVLGFRFVGIRGHVPKGAPETRELFLKAVQDTDVSVVVLTERVAETIRPELKAFIEKRNFPFVVEIADSSGPMPTRKSPSEIITEAIGITI
jgi:V/A-type H+-transporting ATPase subunit F